MTALCGKGSTVAQNTTYSNWGAGFGINVGQTSGSMTNTPYAVKSSSTELSYALSNVPPAARIVITDGAATDGSDDYCYDFQSTDGATGTIKWTSFNTKCYDTPADGKALSGPPQTLTAIKVQTGGLTSVSTFDFCIDSFSF
jgi:hypothetical protein